jgi:hypothetical protein
VYEQEVWWSDKWDPMDYGRAFDFSRPFFEQYRELALAVPRPSLHRAFQYDENADYTNYAGKNKNCYLIFDSDNNWDCYYSYSVNYGKNVMDAYRVRESELCYECMDCLKCYRSCFLQDSENCADSFFLKSCIGVKNSMMCVNLRNKEYHVENKPVSKEQFEAYKKTLLSSPKALKQALEHFNQFKIQFPQKEMHGVNNENVVGDYVNNSKNAYLCFDSDDLWDCRYVFQAYDKLKNCMDIQECGFGELFYECAFMGYDSQSCYAVTHALGGISNLFYCMHTPHLKNSFGCIGVRQKEYCILNKQYTREQYLELAPRIIEYMRSLGEWGEFFPISLSPFAYNETLAQEQYPLTKAQALARGFAWREKDKSEYKSATASVPASIKEVGESICNEILACKTCSRNYRIVTQELKLLKEMGLPIPTQCFLCRHECRRQLRNPRVIYDRACAKCAAPIQTTYAQERTERVYCETCYLKEVY